MTYLSQAEKWVSGYGVMVKERGKGSGESEGNIGELMRKGDRVNELDSKKKKKESVFRSMVNAAHSMDTKKK